MNYNTSSLFSDKKSAGSRMATLVAIMICGATFVSLFSASLCSAQAPSYQSRVDARQEELNKNQPSLAQLPDKFAEVLLYKVARQMEILHRKTGRYQACYGVECAELLESPELEDNLRQAPVTIRVLEQGQRFIGTVHDRNRLGMQFFWDSKKPGVKELG